MLAGGPIGESHDGSLGKDGCPGTIADSYAMEKSKLLEKVPFGHATLDHKGITIDHLGATMGVGTIRPPKKIKSVGKSVTQKMGNLQASMK